MEWMILVTVRLCMSGGDDSELQCYQCGSSYVSATFQSWFRLLLTLLTDVSKRNDRAGEILKDGRWSIMWLCHGEWQIVSICEDHGLPFQAELRIGLRRCASPFLFLLLQDLHFPMLSILSITNSNHPSLYGPHYRHYDTLSICKFTDSPRFENPVSVHKKKLVILRVQMRIYVQAPSF